MASNSRSGRTSPPSRSTSAACSSTPASNGGAILIQTQGDRLAHYIQIPEAGDFIVSPTSTPQEAFYSTIFHDLVHWTRSETRLNREKGARFGDRTYALEELIAELSAAISCAEFGIASVPSLDHAQYLASWLKVLKDDKRAILQEQLRHRRLQVLSRHSSQGRVDDMVS